MPRKTDLNPDLQAAVVECLTLGMTIEATCDFVGISTPTYYAWMKRGERGWKHDEPFVEFLSAVTQAKARAYRSAVVALKTGIMPSQATTEETTTTSETRIRAGKNGEEVPYTYTRTTTKLAVMKSPPDWRAGVEYLKRRDSANWSATTTININIQLIEQTVKALEDAGYDPAAVFNDLIREAASARQSQLSAGGVETTDDRAVE